MIRFPALEAKGATVGAGDFPREAETEATSPTLAMPRLVDAVKALEDLVAHFFGDSASGVDDFERDLAFSGLESDTDLALGPVVLYGVCEEILHGGAGQR